MRWPLQWHQVESNLRFLMKLTESNIKISPFSYTTTPFSLYYQDTYEAWAHDFFKDSLIDPAPMFAKPWQPRSTPMELSAIPQALAEAITNKYGAEHSITKMLVPFDTIKNRQFMQYINYHDQHRHQDWRQVFPEMVKYFQ